jgi:y4mF family transcriptional regulator
MSSSHNKTNPTMKALVDALMAKENSPKFVMKSFLVPPMGGLFDLGSNRTDRTTNALLASSPLTLIALGQLVRSTREASGKSQAEFSALCGVGRRFLSELENGKPTLEIGKVLQVLAAAGIDLFARKR